VNVAVIVGVLDGKPFVGNLVGVLERTLLLGVAFAEGTALTVWVAVLEGAAVGGSAGTEALR